MYDCIFNLPVYIYLNSFQERLKKALFSVIFCKKEVVVDDSKEMVEEQPLEDREGPERHSDCSVFVPEHRGHAHLAPLVSSASSKALAPGGPPKIFVGQING